MVDVPISAGERVIGPYRDKLVELGLFFRRHTFEPYVLSREAHELYTSWRNLFKRTHRLEGSKHFHISGFCRKLENKVLRWSALLHVFADHTEREISVGAMEEAIRLSEYALGHFEHIYQLVQGSAASCLERSLRRYLSRFRGQEVRLRDIRRNLSVFARASEETRKEAFEGLEEDGFLKRKMVKSEQGGRPSPRVVVL